ncbi:hypothetical protein CF327_g2662 [Tilletia walkeri]|nr:hypothetical protein CF327_g2662 [Tilletia walkeri]
MASQGEEEGSRASTAPVIRFYDSDKPFYFLTNFFPSPISHDGLRYATAEAMFQAAKFDDPELRDEIRKLDWPRLAFEKAQSNKDLIRENWEEQSTRIVSISESGVKLANSEY